MQNLGIQTEAAATSALFFLENVNETESRLLFFDKIWAVILISNNVVKAASKGSDKPAHTRSLIRAFASRLNIPWELSYWLNSIWSF